MITAQMLQDLDRAAKLIEEAAAKLNTSAERCEKCNGRHYEAWHEKLAWERIRDMPDRLRETAESLRMQRLKEIAETEGALK